MPELSRRVDQLERRLGSQVSRDLYDRDRVEIRDDLNEIRAAIKDLRDSSTWAVRLVVGQFLALVVGLLLFLLGTP